MTNQSPEPPPSRPPFAPACPPPKPPTFRRLRRLAIIFLTVGGLIWVIGGVLSVAWALPLMVRHETNTNLRPEEIRLTIAVVIHFAGLATVLAGAGTGIASSIVKRRPAPQSKRAEAQ